MAHLRASEREVSTRAPLLCDIHGAGGFRSVGGGGPESSRVRVECMVSGALHHVFSVGEGWWGYGDGGECGDAVVLPVGCTHLACLDPH